MNTSEQNNTNSRNVPQWLKDTSWFINQVGFPVAIVIFMLLVWTGAVGSPITETYALVKDIRSAQIDLITERQRQITLLEHICRNTATTESRLLACDK